jgi:hypothetical protein
MLVAVAALEMTLVLLLPAVQGAVVMARQVMALMEPQERLILEGAAAGQTTLHFQ